VGLNPGGSTSDIIRSLESGQNNLAFIRPVENIGSLRFFSMANDEYLLAVAKDSRLAGLAEIVIEDLRDQKIISFSHQDLSYTQRYFAEMFAEHGLVRNIAYSCDDTFALISLVSAGLGIGFAPQWTRDFPFRASKGEGGGFPDRHGGCLEYGGSDRFAGRHHRDCPLAGQAVEAGTR
jgi:DNA-binding transcriptional LysR family regulator